MASRPFTDNWGITSFVTGVVTTIAVATTADRNFTVPGLLVGDLVFVVKPTLTAGIGIVNARVSAANTLTITYVNATAATVIPANETCLLFWFRPERVEPGVALA